LQSVVLLLTVWAAGLVIKDANLNLTPGLLVHCWCPWENMFVKAKQSTYWVVRQMQRVVTYCSKKEREKWNRN